jgi:hypothetical protein
MQQKMQVLVSESERFLNLFARELLSLWLIFAMIARGAYQRFH